MHTFEPGGMDERRGRKSCQDTVSKLSITNRIRNVSKYTRISSKIAPISSAEPVGAPNSDATARTSPRLELIADWMSLAPAAVRTFVFSEDQMMASYRFSPAFSIRS